MKIKFSFILLLISLTAIAQSPIDSLILLKSASDSPKRTLQLNTLLAKEYAETNADSALALVEHTLREIIKLGNDSMRGQVLIAKSTAWSFKAEYDSSTFYAFQALRIGEKYKDTLTIIDAYNNLGIDFMFLEEDERAMEYFKKVEAFSKLHGDSLRWAHALNNIGMMEGYLGNVERELEYYSQAAEIFKEINEIEGLANTWLNSGTTYTLLGDFNKAEKHYDEALKLFKKINYSSGIQNTLLSAAENAHKKQDFKKAETLAQQALKIALDYTLEQDVVYSYALLSDLARDRGDFKKAYHYQILKADKKEELFTSEKSRQVSELQTKYETEKKESQIARLSLQNELQKVEIQNTWIIILVGGGGALCIVVLLIIVYRQRTKKLKAEQEAQDLQIEALEKRLIDLNITPSEPAINASELNNKIHTPLSDREFEVLRLSLEGKSNTEISEILFISISTVKFHLRNTYGKLGVNNRKEALDYVVKSS